MAGSGQVRAVFPKTRDRQRSATFAWSDGAAAETPIEGRPGSLPHDLDHYIVEAAFGPPYGFWSLVAQQAPFKSLTLIRGTWPPDRAEWLRRACRRHGGELLKAEAPALSKLFAAESADEARRLIPQLRRMLRRQYALSPATDPFADADEGTFVEAWRLHRRVHRAWSGTPFGGALEVAYPPAGKPIVHQRADRAVAQLPAAADRR